ncbi:MAG: hypothetical protein ACLQQ4_14215 [Bacteroidia bacterium]
MERIRNYTTEELFNFTSSELAGVNDIQLLILKGHIIVEYILNCYLESISYNNESDFFNENFSFVEKIKIAKYFGRSGDTITGFPITKELSLLNKLRNDIAHKLVYNEKHLDELLTELHKKEPNCGFNNKNLSMRVKIYRALSFIIGVMCSAYKCNTNPTELDNFLDKK